MLSRFIHLDVVLHFLFCGTRDVNGYQNKQNLTKFETRYEDILFTSIGF